VLKAESAPNRQVAIVKILPGTCDGKRTEAMESALNWRSELVAIETKMLSF
jgi:hypothetical protein